MSSIGFVLFGFVLVLTEHFGACNVLLKTESDEIEKRAVNSPTTPVVAFQATLTTGDIGPNYALGVIKFNNVGLNIGNGYNPNTGKFTAPVRGLYQFTVSYLQKNGFSSHVRMLKGNIVIGDIHANHKNYDQLTKTILVILAKGETFWVRLEKAGHYAVFGGGRYTQFGGLLISVINN